LVKPNMQ